VQLKVIQEVITLIIFDTVQKSVSSLTIIYIKILFFKLLLQLKFINRVFICCF
jgi:uncharacterized protein (DUF486 family)